MARAIPAVALLALAACQPTRPLQRTVGADPLATRRAALSAQAAWSFEGRVAVSDGKDSGSARVSWQQDGARYRVTLRAPVSGETWRLSGDAAGCVLEGVRPEPVRGDDPEALLQRELGWRLPVRALAEWARGLSADPVGAQVSLDDADRPREVREAGWRVVYRDWHDDATPALPKRIEAERPPYQVRLAIASWSTLDHAP